jgi:Sodium:sulfate symporter transmembrane region
MAERMQDGGGTKVEQAERAEQERTEPVEPEWRPTYKTLDEQQGRLTEAEERFERGRRTIGLCLCVILNVASADDVFGSVFDSTILLFIGSFIIAEAMLVHGLDRRFAFNILALRWVGNSTHRIIIAFGFIGAATSPFMSNRARPP